MAESLFNHSTEPVAALVHALQHRPVIALGDAHWYGNVFEQITALMLNSHVLECSQTIVLEMGASRHQTWLDDFIGLRQDASEKQLQFLLLDSLVFPAWLAPHYLEFFLRVREINEQRQKQQQPLIQLHLTEPVFDWADINSPADYRQLFMQRDKCMAEKIITLIEQRQNVLVLCGAWHLLKASMPGKPKTMATLLSETLPNSITSLWPHMHTPLDGHFAQQLTPTLIDLHSNSFGQRPFSDISRMPFDEQNVPTLNQILDGYLYLGPQQRRTDYDFSVWKQVDKEQLMARSRLMNHRQQGVVSEVLMRF